MRKVTLNCVSGFLSKILEFKDTSVCQWEYKITALKNKGSWLTVGYSNLTYFKVKMTDNATGTCSVIASPNGIMSLRELDKQLKPGTKIKMTINENAITEEINDGIYTISCKVDNKDKCLSADNKEFCFEITAGALAKTLNSLYNISENKDVYFTTRGNKAFFSATGKNMTLSYGYDCAVNNDKCFIITQDAINAIKNMCTRKEVPIAVSLVGETPNIIFEANDVLTVITGYENNFKTYPPIPVTETDSALFSAGIKTLRAITDKGTDYAVFLCENKINKISCHNCTWGAKYQIKYSAVTNDIISYKNCEQSLTKQTIKLFLRYAINKHACTVYRKDNRIILSDNGNTTLSLHA